MVVNGSAALPSDAISMLVWSTPGVQEAEPGGILGDVWQTLLCRTRVNSCSAQ